MTPLPWKEIVQLIYYYCYREKNGKGLTASFFKTEIAKMVIAADFLTTKEEAEESPEVDRVGAAVVVLEVLVGDPQWTWNVNYFFGYSA